MQQSEFLLIFTGYISERDKEIASSYQYKRTNENNFKTERNNKKQKFVVQKRGRSQVIRG